MYYSSYHTIEEDRWALEVKPDGCGTCGADEAQASYNR